MSNSLIAKIYCVLFLPALALRDQQLQGIIKHELQALIVMFISQNNFKLKEVS